VLNQAHILVAEDEPFIALSLALAIEDAGGVVVGPAGSVKEALALLQTQPVSAAILDVNLADGDISPVLEILVGLGTPLIVRNRCETPTACAVIYRDASAARCGIQYSLMAGMTSGMSW
jgi:CheY-like chemotaxis protein